MKTDFDGFINRLETAQKRIPELENMSTETFKTKIKEKKRLKKLNRISKNCGTIPKGVTYM